MHAPHLYFVYDIFVLRSLISSSQTGGISPVYLPLSLKCCLCMCCAQLDLSVQGYEWTTAGEGDNTEQI